MAFNGTGVFQRLFNWTNDALNGIEISSTEMDAEDNGFAAGLSLCLTKDGQQLPTANLPMATHKHTGVGNATASDQYAAFGQLQSSLTGGFVNKFRNGTFDIFQRGDSGTLAANTIGYTADGWIVAASGASVAWALASGQSAGCYHALSVTGSPGTADMSIGQRIESYIAQQLLVGNVTVQFVVFNGTGTAITPTLIVQHAGAQDNWTSSTTTTDLSVALQTCANATNTLVSFTFTPNAAIANGLYIALDFGSAVNNSGKVVSILAADIRATPGLPVGLNSSPPQAELRPFPVELIFCQRYYETSYPAGVAPGTPGQTNAGDLQLISLNVADFYAYRNNAMFFKVTKKAPPTIALYNPSTGGSGSFWSYSTNVTQGNSAVGFESVNQFGVYCNNNGLAGAGSAYGTHWTASAEL